VDAAHGASRSLVEFEYLGRDVAPAGRRFHHPPAGVAIEGPKDEFVKYHSTEALNFHITTYIVAFGGLFILAFTRGVEFFVLFWLFLAFIPIIFGIMGMIAANKGKYYRYPVAFRFIKGPTAPAK
jgi:uncharacterized membrane protein